MAWANAMDCNSVEHSGQLADISALSCSHYQRERARIAIHAQVDLAGKSATRTTQPLVSYGPLFFALAAVLRAPVALRCALT